MNLLALPGTLLGARSLAPVVEALGTADARIEPLGGAYGFDGIDGFGAEARRLETVVAGFGAPVVLLGHSLGGMFALELAARMPRRITAVVALASNAHADAPGGTERRAAQWQAWVARGWRALVVEQLAPAYGVAADEACIDALVAQAEATGATRFERQLGYAAGRPGLLTPRRALAVPVLALAGARDALCPPRAAADIVALAALHVPAQQAVHPDAGHLLPTEEPAWTAGQIRDFLGRLVERRRVAA